MPDKRQTHVPGLYRVAHRAVNTYVLTDVGSSITVIDTGFPGTLYRVVKLVQDIGYVPHDVQNILITHADIDHIGDLKALVKATGARVYASAESQVYIQSRRSP